MLKNLSKEHSLAIISDTPLYKLKEFYVFEPVLREVTYLAKCFDKIKWLGYLYDRPAPKNASCAIPDSLNLVGLKPSGGKSLLIKVKILLLLPYYIFHIIQLINKSDVIHTRGPSIPALIALCLTYFYPKKIFWHKYAGNWNQKNPPYSYSLQRLIIKYQPSNSKITINGKWENQSLNMLSFENPCFSILELEKSKKIAGKKNYDNKLNICFVSRLEYEKGVLIIIELIKKINFLSEIGNFYIIGDGTRRSEIEKELLGYSNVFITGPQSRMSLNKVYSDCHIILLPSYASEGFPKVIAEAGSYGCVPIVCNQSSIGQYIANNESGFLLKNLSVESICRILNKVLKDRKVLYEINKKMIEWVSLFTYERYINQIKNKILSTKVVL
jgi:glycosyltransferase involved in cell wall biosynthesis